MRLTSSSFSDNTAIPPTHTCDGGDVIPALSFTDVPTGTKSLALLVDDPDSPSGSWVHWVWWNMSPELRSVTAGLPPVAMEGMNDFGRRGWGGPCPKQGKHRYVFTLWALDAILEMTSEGKNGQETKKELLRAIEGHILAKAVLTGMYERTNPL